MSISTERHHLASEEGDPAILQTSRNPQPSWSLLGLLVTRSICCAVSLCWAIPVNPVLDLTQCIYLFAERARARLGLVCQGEMLRCWVRWIGLRHRNMFLILWRWLGKTRPSEFPLETPLGSLRFLCQSFISIALWLRKQFAAWKYLAKVWCIFCDFWRKVWISWLASR